MRTVGRMLIVGALVAMALGMAGVRTVQAASGGGNITCAGLVTGVVPGNVIVASGTFCALESATIEGNVIVQPGASLFMSNSTVQQNLLSDAAFSVVVQYSQVLGNVELQGDTRAAFLFGVTIGGQADLTGNSGDNVIVFSQVSKDVHFNNNAGFNYIDGNTVAGMLQCDGNTPPPVQAFNVAQSYQGQCAAG